MDKYNIQDRNKLLAMSEDIYDMQHKFDYESIGYMLLQHARDCLLALDEIKDL